MLPLSVISVPLSSHQINSLRETLPFLYRLLTTEELTTPLLQKVLEQPLHSEQNYILRSNSFYRQNRLLTEQSVIELAEIHFTLPCPAWSRLEQPLGPWLTNQGYQIEKKNITPLHFPSHKTIQTLFTLEEAQSCYGRRYDFHVSNNSTRWNLPLIEIWNPCLYSLSFAPLA